MWKVELPSTVLLLILIHAHCLSTQQTVPYVITKCKQLLKWQINIHAYKKFELFKNITISEISWTS